MTWSMVGHAAREVLGIQTRRRRWLYPAAAAVVLAGVALGGYLRYADTIDWPIDETQPVAERVTAPGKAAPAEATPAADDTPEPEAPTGLDRTAPDAVASTRNPPSSTAGAEPLAPPTADLPTRPDPSAQPPARAVALTRPDMTSAETLRLAHAAAFARWGKDFGAAPRSAVPCDFAPSVDLQCLGSTGTWSDLAEYDLPAVLELWDSGSTPFYATLLAMDGNLLTLALGGTVLHIETQRLAEHWFGSFVLLWRMPPGYAGSIRAGDRHPTVAFAREALAALGFGDPAGIADVAEQDQFDPALRDQTLAFQQRAGLRTDGVIGPSTWIALQRARDPETPSLNASPEG
ncbi:MAG: peptidoglycan-binding protein [Gammaproteobacteria bacterium]